MNIGNFYSGLPRMVKTIKPQTEKNNDEKTVQQQSQTSAAPTVNSGEGNPYALGDYLNMYGINSRWDSGSTGSSGTTDDDTQTNSYGHFSAGWITTDSFSYSSKFNKRTYDLSESNKEKSINKLKRDLEKAGIRDQFLQEFVREPYYKSEFEAAHAFDEIVDFLLTDNLPLTFTKDANGNDVPQVSFKDFVKKLVDHIHDNPYGYTDQFTKARLGETTLNNEICIHKNLIFNFSDVREIDYKKDSIKQHLMEFELKSQFIETYIKEASGENSIEITNQFAQQRLWQGNKGVGTSLNFGQTDMERKAKIREQVTGALDSIYEQCVDKVLNQFLNNAKNALSKGTKDCHINMVSMVSMLAVEIGNSIAPLLQEITRPTREDKTASFDGKDTERGGTDPRRGGSNIFNQSGSRFNRNF